MKRYLFIMMLFVIVAPATVMAQYNFVVQNGTSSVYKTVDDAYNNANPGDTIYLPGGSFNLPNLAKGLTWIGVGYHPDSTAATFYTRVNNQFTIQGAADDSYFTGIHFGTHVLMGSSGNDATGVTFFRCRFGANLNLKYNDGAERDVDAAIVECVIDGNITAYKAANCRFEKCIIRGTVSSLRSSYLDRIINTYGGSSGSGFSWFLNDVQSCLVTNSVFPINGYINWGIDVYNNTNNNLQNNIFQGNVTFPAGTNTGSNNITGVDLTTVFEHIEGSLSTFSYLHDFHMKAGSPGIGTGTSGTDISIYSGSSPFKEGGLPVTPHINMVNIDTETSNGLLRVEIGAVSQQK